MQAWPRWLAALILGTGAMTPGLKDRLCGSRSACEVSGVLELSAPGSWPNKRLVAVHVGQQEDGRFELWLLSRSPGQASIRTLLSTVSDNGMDEPPMRLLERADPRVGHPGRFEFYEVHGHLTKDASDWILSVHPLKPLELKFDNGWEGYRESWSWERSAGVGRNDWTLASPRKGPFCGALPGHAFLPIPLVSVDRRWADEGWRTTPIGDCGMTLGGPGGAGYLLQGALPSAPAELKVVAAVIQGRTTLFVDARGGPWVSGTAGWLTDDHLELWCGKASYAQTDPAWDRQWGIRLADGAVFRARGPASASIDVATSRLAPGATALRIGIPACPQLSLSLSKSDGQQVRYLLSSSQLCFGEPATFGRWVDLKSHLGGRCTAAAGALSFLPLGNSSAAPAPDR